MAPKQSKHASSSSGSTLGGYNADQQQSDTNDLTIGQVLQTLEDSKVAAETKEKMGALIETTKDM